MSQLELDAGRAGSEEGYSVSDRKKRSLAVKKAFSAVILYFLYYGLKVLEKRDERIGGETETWEKGFTCGIGMGAGAPALYMKKTEQGLVRLSAKEAGEENMDLMIRFKSVDAAFLVMSGRIGVAGSYARHGFTLRGDIARAMSIVRCMDLAEAYLFPRFISKKILKEVPEKKMGLLHTYVCVLEKMIF